jgi:hypothetical protein
MKTAALQKQFESVLGGRLGWQSKPAPELAPTVIRAPCALRAPSRRIANPEVGYEYRPSGPSKKV